MNHMASEYTNDIELHHVDMKMCRWMCAGKLTQRKSFTLHGTENTHCHHHAT